MSNKMVRGAVAAAVTALAISGSAYGAGKSPNGPPGPAGNPNQPTSAPQANAPQGQGGNEQQKAQNKGQQKKAQRTAGTQQSHGKSTESHGKSTQPHGNSGAPTQSHGKSGSAPGHSNGSHASPTPSAPKSNENNGAPKGKITICHATKSETNPYVEITISVNGLHGHGPADDPHHHAGSWKDIIPAPAGGCPSTVQPTTPDTTKNETPAPGVTTPPNDVAQVVAPEVQTTAPAPAAETGNQAVLGVQESGTSAPAGASAPANEVLGASASGSTPPAAVQAARATDNRHGSLPFTGFGLAFLVILAVVALLGGFALRRAGAANRA